MEMSGIEPESERIDPRISTSIAGFLISQQMPQPAEANLLLTTGAQEPLFRTVSGIAVRHFSFVSPGSTTG